MKKNAIIMAGLICLVTVSARPSWGDSLDDAWAQAEEIIPTTDPSTNGEKSIKPLYAGDGRIISVKKYAFPPFERSVYAGIPERRARYETQIRKEFEATAQITDIETIEYLSDELKIDGFIIKPKDVSGDTRLPVIIFNRGGNRQLGALGAGYVLPWLAQFVQKGYVVLASQYRGSDGKTGNDEYGGRDVHDVLNLIKAARSLPYADPGKIFMMGVSRGGMMTYLALKADPEIKAAAVVSGLCDLKMFLKKRPDMEDVFRELIPEYNANADKLLDERSGCSWPQDIHAPVYILHGFDDVTVDPEQARKMANALRELGKPYKLDFLPGDHGFFSSEGNADEVVDRIDDWFRTYGK